jgi:hypothetical protein
MSVQFQFVDPHTPMGANLGGWRDHSHLGAASAERLSADRRRARPFGDGRALDEAAAFPLALTVSVAPPI